MKKARDHQHGAPEAPPEGPEDADDDRECEKVAARCAKENVDHLGFLLQLCELELLEREARAAAEATEGGAVPGGQDAGHVRLRGGPEGEQAA